MFSQIHLKGGLAARVWGPRSDTEALWSAKGPELGLTLCCHEILNFWTRSLHFYFVLDPVTYAVGLACRLRPAHISLTAPFVLATVVKWETLEAK